MLKLYRFDLPERGGTGDKAYTELHLGRFNGRDRHLPEVSVEISKLHNYFDVPLITQNLPQVAEVNIPRPTDTAWACSLYD
jgi:hypothetical protein